MTSRSSTTRSRSTSRRRARRRGSARTADAVAEIFTRPQPPATATPSTATSVAIRRRCEAQQRAGSIVGSDHQEAVALEVEELAADCDRTRIRARSEPAKQVTIWCPARRMRQDRSVSSQYRKNSSQNPPTCSKTDRRTRRHAAEPTGIAVTGEPASAAIPIGAQEKPRKCTMIARSVHGAVGHEDDALYCADRVIRVGLSRRGRRANRARARCRS